MSGLLVRRAIVPDIAEIMAIFEGRREWLATAKFSDQWETVGEWRALLTFLIRHGNVWVLETHDGESVVGTITVGRDADVDFWTEEEQDEPALYVSRLATDVEYKGQELGGDLLRWALEHARRSGFGRVRLDTWKTSPELQEYYLARGWRHVRTVDLGHRQSGALFERAVASVVPMGAGSTRRVALTAR